MKPKWLNRDVALLGPYLTLCLDEKSFKRVSRHLKIDMVPWIKEGSNATCHTFIHPKRGRCAIVCMDVDEGRTFVQVAGLLIHEATHVWQMYARSIGEHSPGDEQEAYAIQHIATELIADFIRQRGLKEAY